MKLFEINQQYLMLLEKIENGEIPEECIADTLEAIESDLTEKMDNVACFIKSLLAEAVALKEEADKLATRKKQKETKAEQLRLYLEGMMLNAGMKKIETSRNILIVRTSPPSVKVDIGFIPWAMIHKPELLRNKAPEPDKEGIKELLKEGQVVGYCSLQQSEKLNIK